MMQYMYGSWGMSAGFGLVGALTWLVILADLILLGFWLWKQVKK